MFIDLDRDADTITYKDMLGPAMEIRDAETAAIYMSEWIAWYMKWRDDLVHGNKEEAENIIKQNLGYYAGYYDNAKRMQVESLFNCQHPIFGKADKETSVTAMRAFYAGVHYVQTHPEDYPLNVARQGE